MIGQRMLISWRMVSILVLLLILAITANSQQISGAKISLDIKEASLEDVLREISKQSGIPFSYNPRKIPVGQKISYTAQGKSLDEVMSDLSSKVPFVFEWVEGQVVLKPARREDKPDSQKFTISGFITDMSNGEALIGATVIIPSLQLGATSNVFGFYSITIPAGNYSVVYSYIGFEEATESIDLKNSITLNQNLKVSTSVLEEIVVRGTSPSLVSEIQMSKNGIRPSTVSEKPSFFGEADAVKALEAVPGIKMHSDGSTFYYVRGGDRDQNSILIDDAPIFNPSHLLGIFSTIIPEAVNDIQVYKGSMPASLGGRLSSVMDVRTKKGNDQHFAASGSIGLLSTKLSLEGPLKKSKNSYLISGRLSRVKWISNLVNDNIQKFHFYDLTGKLNFDLNKNNKLFFSFYTGSDNFLASNSGIEWANRTTTLRWNHVFNNRLFLNTTIAGGVYDYFLHTDLSTQTKWNSHLSNANLKADFSYFKNPKKEISFGLSIGGYNFGPGNVTRRGIAVQPITSVRNASEFVLYGNHEVRFNDHWGLSYGLRLSTWTNQGASFEFIFDGDRNPIDTLFFAKGAKYGRYENAEPRISMSYFLNERASFKASYARNVQNIHLVSNSISPFTSFEVWLPSSINIKPQTADQLVFGYYWFFQKLGLSLDVETFYKKMRNQIDYEAHAETLLNPLLERELRFGTAIAYGSEIQVRKEEGRLRGWAGYSYSRAKRKFTEINEGKSYNAFYDRPHQINLMLSYDLNLRWNVGLNWNYSTGAPFSSPISFYSINGAEVPIYGQKNNDRLPDYHRLDLSATLQLNRNVERKFSHHISFSIYNFYARKNPVFINYNKSDQGSGNFKTPLNLLNKDALTSQFFLFQFTPSISYNFKWR